MTKQSVEFLVDGKKLRGNLYKPAGVAKDLALLFLHGWTGKPNEDAASKLSENGYIAMTISMRGHNNSEGNREELKIAEFFKDAEAAYDLLRQKVGPDMKIGVVGNSFGAYMATLLSGTRKVNCLSLRVPANYREEDYHEKKVTNSGSDNPRVLEWRKNKLTPAENKALKLLQTFKGPVQIIEAEKDTVVPHQTVQNFVDAVSDKSKLDYVVMKDWPHSLGDDPVRNKQFQEVLLSWLKNQ
jgi:esterase/lipase